MQPRPGPRRVIIIGEDHERSLPLLRALEAAGMDTEVWNVSGGCLRPTFVPEDAVYFCRQSPSAGTRGRAHAIPYVRSLLSWLALHRRTVLNGLPCLDAETSKGYQAALLRQAGINTPRTVLVSGRGFLRLELQAAASPAAPRCPYVLKPDLGGSGNGVEAWPDAAAALAAVVSGAAPSPEGPPEGPWVLQEHMGPYSTDPTRIRTFLRFEMVGGKVLYAMQVRAPSTEFKLCPCDPRMKAMLANVDFRILTDMRAIPCFADSPAALPRFLAKLESVWARLGAAVGSVEAFLPPAYLEDAAAAATARTSEEGAAVPPPPPRQYSADATAFPDEPVVFDMNFNSNYNEAAEEAAGIHGAAAVVALLRSMAMATASPPALLPPS